MSGGDWSNLSETAITELVESYKGRDDLIIETVFEIVVDDGAYSDSHYIYTHSYPLDSCTVYRHSCHLVRALSRELT